MVSRGGCRRGAVYRREIDGEMQGRAAVRPALETARAQ
jgi:hypothetical protein